MNNSSSYKSVNLDEVLAHYGVDNINPEIFVPLDDHSLLQNIQHKSKGNTNRYTVLQKRKTKVNVLSHGIEDPLGIHRNASEIVSSIASPQSLATFDVSSEKFSALEYLSKVHGRTSYRDLEYGLGVLERTIQAEESDDRLFVQKEFDRFIKTKDIVDTVYNEMKKGPLDEKSEYGIANLKTSVDEARQAAENLFKPIFEAGEQSKGMEQTSEFIDKHRLFLEMPSILLNLARKNNIEEFVKLYPKAEATYRSLVPMGVQRSPLENQNSASSETTEFFNKVWQDIESVLSEYQADLWQKLYLDDNYDTSVSNLKIIMSIGDRRNQPLLPLLESKHLFIKQRFGDLFKSLCLVTEQERTRLINAQSPSKVSYASLLYFTNQNLASLEDGSVAEATGSLPFWLMLDELIHKGFEDYVVYATRFWKVCLEFMNNNEMSENEVFLSENECSKVRAIISDLINHIVHLMSSFWRGSETAKEKPKDEDLIPAITSYAFISPYDNHCWTCKLIVKVISNIYKGSRSLVELSVSCGSDDEVRSAISHMLTKIREYTCSALCEIWLRDAASLKYHDDWLPTDDSSAKSSLPKNLFRMESNVIKDLSRLISFGLDNNAVAKAKADADELSVIIFRLGSKLNSSLRKTFLDSIRIVTDNFMQAALSVNVSNVEVDEQSNPSPMASDFRKTNKEKPVLIASLALREIAIEVLPRLSDEIKEYLDISMKEDVRQCSKILENNEMNLLNTYTLRRAKDLDIIIVKGVRGSDWGTREHPGEVQPFILMTLLSMVSIHAAVFGSAPSQMEYIMTQLTSSVASSLKKCMLVVPKFGLGGMLQATLDVEFLHQTLNDYVTKPTAEILRQVYATIEEKYDRTDHSRLKEELANVKKLLSATRKKTHTEFLCFKRSRTSEKPDLDRSR